MKTKCCVPTVIHHIKPRYLGGTDEPENLIELTYKEHATAHFLLWLQHHDERDWLAWRGCEGLIGKEEIHKEISSIGGKKSYAEGLGIHDKTRKSEWGKMGAAAAYAKHKEKIVAQLRENAKRNSELGLGGYEAGKWIWITNGRESKKVLKVENISDGWRRGRHSRSTQRKTA